MMVDAAPVAPWQPLRDNVVAAVSPSLGKKRRCKAPRLGGEALSDDGDDWTGTLAEGFVAHLRSERAAADKKVGTIEQRVAEAANAKKPSRQQLHDLLDACLDLRENRLATLSKSEDAARRIAQALLTGSMQWVDQVDRPHLGSDWEAVEADPVLRRQEIWYRLVRTPSLLPTNLMRDLQTALLTLDDGTGTTPDLLRPLPKPGKGRSPKEARSCEEALWEWIMWRAGQGARVSDSTNEVALAVNRSSKAVDAWRIDWRKRVGQQEVDEVLTEARARGEAGEPFRGNVTMEDLASIWLWAIVPPKAIDT